jgi:hypothetical protein
VQGACNELAVCSSLHVVLIELATLIGYSSQYCDK